MPELIAAYWPYLLAAFAIGIAVAWFAFAANRKTAVRTEKKDVLDEGAAPAARNQALIDAPQAAVTASEQDDPAPVATSDAPSEDLTRIKGLGPKLQTMLNGLGISSYAQIAAWNDAEIDRIDAQLDRFAGRIRRDNWVEQAKMLSSGDAGEFAQKFGQDG